MLDRIPPGYDTTPRVYELRARLAFDEGAAASAHSYLVAGASAVAGTDRVAAGLMLVDAARNEIWMVVTPEAPTEPLERSMALYFGAALPAADELSLLLEGYGLHVAGAPDVDPQLQGLALPPLALAEIKRAVYDGVQQPLDGGLELERELIEKLFRSKDANEGLTAFSEKRAPEFVGA